MSILADLEKMEARVQEIVQGIEDKIDPATERYRQAVTSAVIQVLDDYELGALSEADLATVVEDALADLTPQLQSAVQQQIATQLQETVTLTREFYAAQGIDPPGVAESVRRSREAAQLTQALDEGMSLVDEDLKEETLDVLLETVSQGTIDQDVIADRIAERADVATSIAETQARTSLTAHNQLYRNRLADEAELKHFLYFGTLKTNSRSFCRLHAGNIYDENQIEQMDNGMLNPVRVYKGGYNCRHSWVPVDPQWDEELQDKVVDRDDPDTLDLDASGNRTITGFAPDTTAGRRRLRQAELRTEGYTEFLDAEDNDEGFVALHRTWKSRYNDFPDGHDVREDMKAELQAGKALKETSSEALYTRKEKNLKGTGDVDVIWDGKNTEIKTPTKFHAGALNRPLDPRQSNNFLIGLREPLNESENAYYRLREWMSNNPEKEVSILHYYDNNRLEEVTL